MTLGLLSSATLEQEVALLDTTSRARLFGWRQAFDEPAVLPVTVAIVALLVAGCSFALLARRSASSELRREIGIRTLSWCLIAPLIVVPVLLGAAWTIALVFVLALLSYREFARATGLFRERLMSALVVAGIVAIHFAALDHWYGFFVALPSLTLGVIALAAILKDRPKGYVQRIGMSMLAYLLFGVALGHLAYFANDARYRSLVLLVIVAVQLNDVFAFVSGKALGKRKLVPNTSPNKTIAGALGALFLTSITVWVLGALAFDGELARPAHLLALGVIISVAGQAGDLMISSVKRDVGIKDMGVIIPGHGGVLDRTNSLLLAAPAAFHYIHWVQGVGLDQPVRILTGGS